MGVEKPKIIFHAKSQIISTVIVQRQDIQSEIYNISVKQWPFR